MYKIQFHNVYSPQKNELLLTFITGEYTYVAFSISSCDARHLYFTLRNTPILLSIFCCLYFLHLYLMNSIFHSRSSSWIACNSSSGANGCSKVIAMLYICRSNGVISFSFILSHPLFKHSKVYSSSTQIVLLSP